MALANLRIYYTWKNTKSAYKIYAPIYAPTPDILDLPDGTMADNFPVQNYNSKIKNRIAFKKRQALNQNFYLLKQ